MAIHFISGKPGSGKSLYGVHLLLKEITGGHRNVVTNLPLHPGRLNEYLQQKYPLADLRLLQRLTVLTEDQARIFWKFRGEDDGKMGVMYQLDELHLFFNARDWMQTGRECLHYLSQHRKLGDVVIAITQSVPNVDKQFRSVAEDFTVLRNEYTAKFGPFRGRGRFVRKTYLSEPTGSGHQEPFETASFTLDAKGIASCYDTAQGIGIHGNTADKGRKAKGWSIWWVIPLGIGLASLAGIIPWFMAKGAAAIVTPDHVSLNNGSTAVAAIAKSSSEENAGISHAEARPFSTTGSIWVTGYVARGRKINVTLSDGRTLTERDDNLARVERNFIELKTGERLWLKSPIPLSEGAGVRVTPDRKDGVPPSEVIADSLTGSRSGGMESRTQSGRENSTTLPLHQPLSSWYIAPDGTQRLRETPKL